MATSKTNYVELELEWLENKAEDLKKYVDTNPINELKDRVNYKTVKGGGQIPIISSTIEQQIKSIRDTLQDYIKIIDAISKLREKDESAKKINARGNQTLTPMEMGIV
jgi:hypothetical protein